jgi:hypothetical protein
VSSRLALAAFVVLLAVTAVTGAVNLGDGVADLFALLGRAGR